MSSFRWFIGGPYLYVCLLVFIGVTAKKLIGYATMPRHLRWDLYPLPHRGEAGSKYQLVDFYKVKQNVSLWGEFSYMFMEIIFIRKAFLNNPKIWKGSFPMHMGLYLSAAWLFLLGLGIISEKISGVPVTPINDWFWISALYYGTVVTGSLALVAGLCGSLFLLYLRLTDEDLRDISDFPAYINLILLIALFGSGLWAWLTVDPAFSLLRSHLAAVFTFAPASPLSIPLTVEIFFMGLFLAYLPFSRMTHYAAKYFFYHNIMWDDEPMKSGSGLEKDVTASLGGKLSWSASHIKHDQSWLAQVSPDAGNAGKEGTDKK